MLIKDLNSLRRFFKKIERSIFGAGIYAFNRLGPEEFFSNYQILSLYSSKETELIKKDVPVFCLQEKIKSRLCPRNSLTLISHVEIQKYISRFKDPLILFYQSSGKIEKLAYQYKFKAGVPHHRFGKQFFEDKIKFRRILQEIKVPSTPGRVLLFPSFMSLQFSQIEEEFGLPFVLQHPKKGGGEGTFFIKDKNDFQRSKGFLYENPAKEIIIARFIDGPSPSMTGCVTRHGILSTRPQYQICDVPILYSKPTGSGLFCGHDWSASEFSSDILLQAEEIIEKIGNYFRKLGYLGIFGIDFVENRKEGKLYVTECNPRLLGSMPVLTMTEVENNIPPIIAFHVLEYLEIPYEIDIKRILRLLWRKREGAQMILHSSINQERLQRGECSPGIYRVLKKRGQPSHQNSRIEYLRKGYKLSSIQDEGEFLLTGELQDKNSTIKPYQRIGRVLTRRRILNKNLKEITPEAEDFVRLILKKIEIASDL